MKRTIFETEHHTFRESAARFFRTEIGPHSERYRRQGYVDREAFLAAGRRGLLLLWAPEEYGGAAISDMRYEQIVSEENIRHGDSGFYSNLHSMIVAPYLARHATEAQQRRWLPGAIRGETILAIAMTEPGAGSDLAGMRTRAELNARGEWVLSGAKTYISNGMQADLVIVAARTGGAGSRSVGLFLVENGMPGFSRGRRLHKMGLQSQDTSELFFDSVVLPPSHVLGDPHEGFRYLAQSLVVERLQVAISSVTAAQVALELTLDFVKERKAFGRPIGLFQDTRFRLAQMRASIDAIQSHVDQCVLLANSGELTSADASAAKLVATELEGRVLDECVQMHGGAGYMEEYRVCRMYQDARVTRIFAGTSEIMKEIISRGLGLDERVLANNRKSDDP
ncbi:MAG: acyl-CoA dehydrogenase [Gammaproteobacteria bacterium]|nr:acyl-CoA dehydrogenase [Gammaproteobacteria bacterium]